MRKVRYQVAMSLDGFIADHLDGYGWIPEEPGFDFSALCCWAVANACCPKHADRGSCSS